MLLNIFFLQQIMSVRIFIWILLKCHLEGGIEEIVKIVVLDWKNSRIKIIWKVKTNDFLLKLLLIN